MADTNATDSVPRRNVLKTVGGALTGATLLAGRGAATREDCLQFDVQDANEEVIVARVVVPTSDDVELARDTYLGVASQFVVRDDAVRLPENAPDVLATPVEVERLDSRTYRMVFPIRNIDWSAVSGERIELGLGTFQSFEFHDRCRFGVVPVDPLLWCDVEITHPPDEGKVTLARDDDSAPTTWGEKVPIRLNGNPEAKLTFEASSSGIELPGSHTYLNCHSNWTLEWDYRQYTYTNGQLKPKSWVRNVGTGSPISLWLEDDQCAPRWYDVRVRAVDSQGTVVASDTNRYGVNIVGC